MFAHMAEYHGVGLSQLHLLKRHLFPADPISSASSPSRYDPTLCDKPPKTIKGKLRGFWPRSLVNSHAVIERRRLMLQVVHHGHFTKEQYKEVMNEVNIRVAMQKRLIQLQFDLENDKSVKASRKISVTEITEITNVIGFDIIEASSKLGKVSSDVDRFYA
eukprot:324239_1